MAAESFSLIVPFKDDESTRGDNWHWCWRWWHRAVIGRDFEVCLGGDSSDPFNRSRARNNAYSKAKHDTIVIADADTVIDPSSLIKGLSMVSDGIAPWVIPYTTYYNLSEEYSVRLKMADGFLLPNEKDLDFSYEHRILSWAGILILSRDAFDSVGGYDERFEGWGWEDNAFRLKLDMEYGEHQRCEGNAYHLWHPIAEADKFGAEQTNKNRRLYVSEYESKYNHRDERLTRKI